MGFIIAHFLLVWCVVGFVMPQWLDIFIIPERRDDWKQPLAPGVLRDTTEGEVVDRLETGSQLDMTEGKRDDSVNNNIFDGKPTTRQR